MVVLSVRTTLVLTTCPPTPSIVASGKKTRQEWERSFRLNQQASTSCLTFSNFELTKNHVLQPHMLWFLNRPELQDSTMCGAHYISKYLRATRISIYYGLLQKNCWAFYHFWFKCKEFWADETNEEKSRVSLSPKSKARVQITWGPPGSNVTVVVSPLLPTWGRCQFFFGRRTNEVFWF